MDSRSLYQRVLGSDSFKLPAILQQFHSLPGGGRAGGLIDVERGAGLARHFASQVLGLPNAGRQVPLRLQVIPEDDKEIWIRHFDGHVLETLQWQEDSFLVEKAGPSHFLFRVSADEQGLTFYPRAHRMQGVYIPDRLSLRVNANAQGTGYGWNIQVTIAAPLLGEITTYRGDVIPQLC